MPHSVSVNGVKPPSKQLLLLPFIARRFEGVGGAILIDEQVSDLGACIYSRVAGPGPSLFSRAIPIE